MDGTVLLALILACAPRVDPTTVRAIVAVESSVNPYAIGVVGGVLDRQPLHLAEAIATAHALRASGWRFSVGLAQINVTNFERLGLTIESAFDPCINLAAMQTILGACADRAPGHARDAQLSLRQALSCYSSGNFSTGFDRGYVRQVALAVARIH